VNSVDRLNKIRDIVPSNIKIVAVSKTKPATSIDLLYSKTGQRLFGENKVQELEAKHEILPHDIEWHFIGHLQTNKIKYIAPFVSLIQSVDSYRLIREINKEALKQNRIIPCLLQFYIAREEAKYGFSLEEVFQMLDDNLFHELSNISIAGVMGMATYTNDEKLIRTEFRTLFGYFKLIKSKYFAQKPDFCEISMGMTEDYLIAVEEGSTVVRIGSGIFGER
jgi:pyridoxal phosphate enzyme (YggS family)